MADIRFIDRDAQGQICGTYACKQREGQELLPVDSPELVAWQNSMEQARADEQTLERARTAELRAIADHQRNAPRKIVDAIGDLREELLAQHDAYLRAVARLNNAVARLDHMTAWAKTKGYPGYPG